MGKATMICKVCGKEYPYCNTIRDEGLFRWQDVACCPEHGSEYFAAVAAARAEQKPVKKDTMPEAEPAKETPVEEDPYDYLDDDDVFADDDEDEDDFDGYWYEEEFDQ